MRRQLGRGASAAVAAAVVLSGCGADQTNSAESPDQPVTVVTTEEQMDQAVGQAVVLHLNENGVPAEVQTAETAQPWDDVGEDTVVVGNSLRMAAQIDPEELMATGTADQSVTMVTEAMNDDEASAATTGEVIAESPGTLRLNTVMTTATAGYWGLSEMADLDPENRASSENTVIDEITEDGTPDRAAETTAEVCGQLHWYPGSLPEPLRAAAQQEFADIGCELSFGDPDPSLQTVLQHEPDVVTVLFGPDPTIADQGLAALDDSAQLLPEGRYVAVAEPGLDDEVTDPLAAVLGELDGEQLTELARAYRDASDTTSDQQQTGGIDLSTTDAVRYWLVDQQLMEPPSDWF